MIHLGKGHEFPMVFGTETEFGFSYGKVLDEGKAALFNPDCPELIFYLIIKSVVKKTGAFVREPWIPWERLGLNHLGNAGVKVLVEAATSGVATHLVFGSDNLTPFYKNLPFRNIISPRDIFVGEVGVFLPNGSRLYIDGSQLEYSVSEGREPYEVVCQEKAMERLLAEIVIELQEVCGRELYLFKNNTDYKGHSYGCHENYLLDREFFRRLYEDNQWRESWLSFVTTQIIYTGAGKVGSESGDPCDFQISQRADHFSEIVGSATMNDRPIINYRGEPLADGSKWGRFHVILDDSSMSEWSTFLKVGTKALVLNMLQSQYVDECDRLRRQMLVPVSDYYKDLFLSDPVHALRFISRDLTCKKPLTMNTKGFSALEIQKKWLAVVKHFYSWGYKEKWIFDVIEKWGQVLHWIEKNNPILDSMLDWRIKKRFIDSYTSKRLKAGSMTSIESLQLIDINYSDITHRGYYNRLPHINRLAADADIEKARMNASPKTRAWLRGEFIKRFPEHLDDVSWELLIFNLKIGDFAAKVRLEPDPMLSTKFLVGWMFDQSENYEEFCKRFLGSYLNHRELF